MKTEEEHSEVLDEIAGRIADGAEIDWDEALDSHEDLSDSLRRLRLVESVALLHRTPLPEDDAAEEEISGMETQGGPASPAPEAGPPIERWGKLEIKRRLGVGGFGEVYRAFHPGLGKDVALKLLKPGRDGDRRHTKRFVDEAKRHAKVGHPNVLPIHGVDEHDGRIGLYTELVEGQTLEERLKKSGRFSAEEAAIVGSKICRALAAVHGAGLVHRDVKTGNIMRRARDGHILLMDFSAACEQPRWEEVFSNEPRAGTPLFVAPEVLRGEEAGVRADIYSLGVVLYRMVSGRFPFEGRSQEELAANHAAGDMKPLLGHCPDLSPLFIKIVERALATDPGARYASAGDLMRDLGAFLGEPADSPAPASMRRRILLVLVAAGGAALVLATVAVSRFLVEPAPPRVTAELYRLNQGAEELLHPGGLVYPDDHLFLEIETSAPMHTYVMNLDSSGDLLSIYPLDEAGMQKTIDPGLRYRIPGVVGGETRYWVLGELPGVEIFFVIASRNPLEEVRRIFDLTNSVEQEPPVHRGVTAIEPVPGGRAVPSDPEVAALLERVFEIANERPDVWAWRIQLENQGP